jgi:hypothetical protein
MVSTARSDRRGNKQQQQQWSAARSSRSSRRSWWIGIVSFLLLLSLYGSIYQWNQSYVDLSLEAPLDHFQSALWTPLFHLAGCPDMNTFTTGVTPTSTTSTAAAATATTGAAATTTAGSSSMTGNNNIRSKINISSSSNINNISTIPMIMISARPYELVAPVRRTWTDAHFPMIVFNTTAMSRDYVNTRCANNNETFKSRLFGIYQQVLATYVAENEYIVTVEDDVRLLDGETLRHELQLAVERQYQYYSFTRNAPTPTCLYRFGTTAQLWSRSMVQKILNVDDDTYCRLPIDMYIAQQGPWYVTQRPLVQHVGQRLTNIP